MIRASTFSSISAQAASRTADNVASSFPPSIRLVIRFVARFLSGSALSSVLSGVWSSAFVFGLAGTTSLVFAGDAPRPADSRADIRDSKNGDALEWLERISRAGREHPYTGVYVHSTPENSASTRITHFLDKQGVEHEKIESLDGPMREIIRRTEEMYCYQPQEKVVLIDRRTSGRFFPSLVTGNPKKIAENYRVKMGPKDRIADHDCQWIILEPRDSSASRVSRVKPAI